MNKIEYTKKRSVSLFGWKILRINDYYVERSYDDIQDDTLPIVITETYANEEFKNVR